jgi:hypothetical protein
MSVRQQPLPNPSYLPPGFVHRLDVFGTDTAAFGFDSEQVARIFTRDLTVESWTRPLVIAAALATLVAITSGTLGVRTD